MEETMKVCSACGVPLPANDEYFGPRKSSEDGFRSECYDCQKKAEQVRRDKKKLEKLDDPLDNRLQDVVNTFIDNPAALEFGGMSALSEAALAAFGGPEGLMARYSAQYIAMDAGSTARTRILDSIMRIVEKAEKLGAGAKENELITKEELEERAEAMLLKFTKNVS